MESWSTTMADNCAQHPAKLRSPGEWNTRTCCEQHLWAGTMNEVYLFRDGELLDSIFEVNRDAMVEFASWQRKKPAPVELMPGNGSWVRIQLDPDSLRPRLSCAAQVYQRFKSGKKATLIFWDEQKKQSHGIFDCGKVKVYFFQDSLRTDI